jgi:hypothetical protein
MPSIIAIPMQVFGLGAVISFGIAVLIKVILDAIRFFNKKADN